MQLKKIQEYIQSYKKYLKSPQAYDLLYLWESQFHFQNKWDTEREDFVKMLDECFQNATTKRLWKREAYYPKKMLLALATLQPDFVRHMFFDLFNEDKAIDSRCDRFRFYCDELMIEYRRAHPISIDTGHYQDYAMISLYLAFRYPSKYPYYNANAFKKCLQGLGAKNLPLADDIERFFKLSKTLKTFIYKDEELLQLHQKRLLARHYQEDSMLLVSEFMQVLF